MCIRDRDWTGGSRIHPDVCLCPPIYCSVLNLISVAYVVAVQKFYILFVWLDEFGSERHACMHACMCCCCCMEMFLYCWTLRQTCSKILLLFRLLFVSLTFWQWILNRLKIKKRARDSQTHLIQEETYISLFVPIFVCTMLVRFDSVLVSLLGIIHRSY